MYLIKAYIFSVHRISKTHSYQSIVNLIAYNSFIGKSHEITLHYVARRVCNYAVWSVAPFSKVTHDLCNREMTEALFSPPPLEALCHSETVVLQNIGNNLQSRFAPKRCNRFSPSLSLSSCIFHDRVSPARYIEYGGSGSADAHAQME